MDKEKMNESVKNLDLSLVPKKMNVSGPVGINADGKVNPVDNIPDKK
jgi:hypothetical protein